MPRSHSILQVYLAINDATNKAMNLRKQHPLVLIELLFMLGISFCSGEFDSAELSLKYQTSFMRVLGEVDLDREFDTICVVDFFVDLLLICPKPYIMEFICLYDS